MVSRPVPRHRFPLPTETPLEPPDEYAALRATAPVAPIELPGGHPGWLVCRHADIRAVCADNRFSKAALTAPDAPRLLPVARSSSSLFSMDPPQHTRLRRLVASAFTARRMEALRPRVQAITDELLDRMAAAGPPADLVAGLAQPLPIRVICELLGVPYGDVEQFRQWTDRMLDVAGDPDAVLAARRELHRYLAGLLAAKRAEPSDDVLGHLVQARDEGDLLSEDELLTFAHTLLVAGYHATTGQLVFSVLTLLSRPEGMEPLRGDADAVATAVEELLRWSTIGDGLGMVRIAVEDVSLGGVTVHSGDPVIPALSSGNRDADAFADPETLDLRRNPNPHLAFGAGFHHCLGAQLGRIELQVALGSLARRWPRFDLAVPPAELEWSRRSAVRRPLSLPVTW